MDSFEKHALKQEARRRLRAQRQRAGQLRARVVTVALIGFVLLWGVIFAQMATGHDPVLGDKAKVATVSSAGKKHLAEAIEPPVEAAETDAEEDDAAEQSASEAIETTDPEELEQEAAEREAAEASALEAAEAEAAEAEAEAAEAEPAPVTTSQS